MLPDTLVARATGYLAGEIEPALPRDASTVLLLRDTAAGLEVYVLRRQLSMAFAGGMYAFPGGSVDPRDSDRHISWAGPRAEEWAHRLVCDAALARALVCAAVRELFEESGVLLAGSGPGDVVSDTTAEDWERERAALTDHSLPFAELLARRGLVLRSDLLGYWAHWTTPEFEPRRYDTRFFVAALPVGQRTRDVSGEADHVAWEFPAEVVTAADERRAAMLPPTYVALADLTRYADVAAVLSAAAAPDRPIPHVVPGVEVVNGGAYLTLPDGVLP